MLIRGLFPDLHLIFCGGENEMPDCKDISAQSGLDCADRKTPGKEQAGGGLSLGFHRPLRQDSHHADGGEQDQQGGHFSSFGFSKSSNNSSAELKAGKLPKLSCMAWIVVWLALLA